jgi:alkanesulfonate monooxygenase SsuD/methylene tetrahydromethanopterin reductase-like flavin-dependent oxidoreductase (luciferase family)
MKIGYFSENPYQHPSLLEGGAADRMKGVEAITSDQQVLDLQYSNSIFEGDLGATIYNRGLDEKCYAEEVGFDMLMLNEHHSTAFTTRSTANLEAAILARITDKPKIVILGNILPLWDDPLWLAEMLAMIDTVSRGRLVSGWVRGTGRESISHNIPGPYNWERFQEAHDLIIKAWTDPGPFRWEGDHFHYRYVNPWPTPYQKPHPPIWIPGQISKSTVRWAAERGYPYVLLAAELEPSKGAFDYYDSVAREHGYEAGPQHRGYMFKLHVEETDEQAYEVGRKFLEGPPNLFLAGSRSNVNPVIQGLPGITARSGYLPTIKIWDVAAARGRNIGTPVAADRERGAIYDAQLEKLGIVVGTPTSVMPKIRKILETLRPGHIVFWDGDGAMTHEDTMRSLKLMGTEVLPQVREIADELGLCDSFEVDMAAGRPVETV